MNEEKDEEEEDWEQEETNLQPIYLWETVVDAKPTGGATLRNLWWSIWTSASA